MLRSVVDWYEYLRTGPVPIGTMTLMLALRPYCKMHERVAVYVPPTSSYQEPSYELVFPPESEPPWIRGLNRTKYLTLLRSVQLLKKVQARKLTPRRANRSQLLRLPWVVLRGRVPWAMWSSGVVAHQRTCLLLELLRDRKREARWDQRMDLLGSPWHCAISLRHSKTSFPIASVCTVVPFRTSFMVLHGRMYSHVVPSVLARNDGKRIIILHVVGCALPCRLVQESQP